MGRLTYLATQSSFSHELRAARFVFKEPVEQKIDIDAGPIDNDAAIPPAPVTNPDKQDASASAAARKLIDINEPSLVDRAVQRIKTADARRKAAAKNRAENEYASTDYTRGTVEWVRMQEAKKTEKELAQIRKWAGAEFDPKVEVAFAHGQSELLNRTRVMLEGGSRDVELKTLENVIAAIKESKVDTTKKEGSVGSGYTEFQKHTAIVSLERVMKEIEGRQINILDKKTEPELAPLPSLNEALFAELKDSALATARDVKEGLDRYKKGEALKTVLLQLRTIFQDNPAAAAELTAAFGDAQDIRNTIFSGNSKEIFTATLERVRDIVMESDDLYSTEEQSKIIGILTGPIDAGHENKKFNLPGLMRDLSAAVPGGKHTGFGDVHVADAKRRANPAPYAGEVHMKDKDLNRAQDIAQDVVEGVGKAGKTVIDTVTDLAEKERQRIEGVKSVSGEYLANLENLVLAKFDFDNVPGLKKELLDAIALGQNEMRDAGDDYRKIIGAVRATVNAMERAMEDIGGIDSLGQNTITDSIKYGLAATSVGKVDVYIPQLNAANEVLREELGAETDSAVRANNERAERKAREAKERAEKDLIKRANRSIKFITSNVVMPETLETIGLESLADIISKDKINLADAKKVVDAVKAKQGSTWDVLKNLNDKFIKKSRADFADGIFEGGTLKAIKHLNKVNHEAVGKIVDEAVADSAKDLAAATEAELAKPLSERIPEIDLPRAEKLPNFMGAFYKMEGSDKVIFVPPSANKNYGIDSDGARVKIKDPSSLENVVKDTDEVADYCLARILDTVDKNAFYNKGNEGFKVFKKYASELSAAADKQGLSGRERYESISKGLREYESKLARQGGTLPQESGLYESRLAEATLNGKTSLYIITPNGYKSVGMGLPAGQGLGIVGQSGDMYKVALNDSVYWGYVDKSAVSKVTNPLPELK